MNNDQYYDWTSLEAENSDIVAGIIKKWEALLDQESTEKEYHEFIKEHSGFFFSDYNCYLTISKLKLASELETDFINIRDQRSNGLVYEFIELEKPQSKLFTKKGVPAVDFNNAIQQIRDWKRFLIDHKSWFKKYLPTYTTRVISNSCIKFSIVIGRRTTHESEIEKRNQIASELGIEIRSFDYLTDLLKRRKFFNSACLDIEKSKILENHIENPFSKAISDSDWKEFCLNKFNSTHFYKNNAEEIVKLREYNDLIHQMK